MSEKNKSGWQKKQFSTLGKNRLIAFATTNAETWPDASDEVKKAFSAIWDKKCPGVKFPFSESNSPNDVKDDGQEVKTKNNETWIVDLDDEKQNHSDSTEEKETDKKGIKSPEDKSVIVGEYRNKLNGPLCFPGLVFPAKQSKPVPATIAETKKFKHAVKIGILKKV